MPVLDPGVDDDALLTLDGDGLWVRWQNLRDLVAVSLMVSYDRGMEVRLEGSGCLFTWSRSKPILGKSRISG
jgi:hypothetical protein